MTYSFGCVVCGKSLPHWPTYEDDFDRILWMYNGCNEYSPCQCYQDILDRCKTDILIYIHNDVDVHDEGWARKIARMYDIAPALAIDLPESPVVAIGLGGATALGNVDLYRRPYNINNMARGGYASNQTDAETHGERFTGVRHVAVLDAFCVAVRVDWLRNRGGWPVDHLTHHCLDLWLACEAARCRKEIWMVGASCTHHGGGVSITNTYAEAKWLQGGTLETDHSLPHKWLWDEYRDVLPLEV